MNRSNHNTSSHYYSVFTIALGEPELNWLGFSAKGASWQFYKAIVAASGKPGARVDLCRDSKTLASVPITSPAIA